MVHIECLYKEDGDMARHVLKTLSLTRNGNTTLCMLCALSCMSFGLHFSCEKIACGLVVDTKCIVIGFKMLDCGVFGRGQDEVRTLTR